MRTTTLLAAFLTVAAVMASNSKAFGETPATQPANESLERALREASGAHPRALPAPSECVPPNVSRDNKFRLQLDLDGGPGLNLSTFSQMVESAPKGILSDEIRRQLQSGGNVVGIQPRRTRHLPQSPQFFTYEIGVAAPTDKRARDLARGLVAACEYAWKKNGRDYVLREITEEKQQLAELTEKAKQARQQYDAAIRLLRQYDTVLAGQVKPGEIITGIAPKSVVDDLRARQYLVGVDIAASRAKIDAAKKLLEAKVPPSQQDILNNILVQAQIDLAGLLSQQKTLPELLAALSAVDDYDPTYFRDETERLTLSVANLQKAMESGSCIPTVVRNCRIDPIRWMDE